MKVLLDEGLPHRLRELLHGHEVSTVRYAGYAGLKNGTLLRTAESAGYEVFVTADQGVASEQNLEGRSFGVILLSAQKMTTLCPFIDVILKAITDCRPGCITRVDCGTDRRQALQL